MACVAASTNVWRVSVARRLAPVAVLVGVYALAVRPRLLRWGATDAEIARAYPGGDLIPDGVRGATMAVTIDAPPARVWPWLAQMGTDRGGWYSWDRLDNWASSAERIHPEWQEISLGDRLAGSRTAASRGRWRRSSTSGSSGSACPWTCSDARSTGGARPRFYTDSLWGFQLKDRTHRLVVSCWSLRPQWLRS